MSAPALELRGVRASYGRTEVLRGVDLTVPAGATVALMGPNGAGKTTLLRLAAGLVRASHGRVDLAGDDVTHRAPHLRAKAGLCLVPEGRGIFPNLSVLENLRLQVPRGADTEAGITRALDAFPALKDRRSQAAGSMSGGQQQMLALGRCFTSTPRVVLLDEVSMGLAPRVVDEIFEALRGLSGTGVAVLLVEQYVGRALEMADRIHLLDRGRVGFSGPPSAMDEDELMRRYMGVEAPA